jgi:capping protein alpha
MPHVTPALRAYNLAQLHVVEHQTVDATPAHAVSVSGELSQTYDFGRETQLIILQSVLSEASILPGSEPERYVDADSKRSFAFDHVTLVSSSPSNLFQPDFQNFKSIAYICELDVTYARL